MVASSVTQGTNGYLSHDQVSSIQNLFLLELKNKDFVLGTVTRRPNALTPMASILLLLIGVVVAGVFGFAAGWAVGLITAAIFVVLGVAAFVSARRQKRLDEDGKLLSATISNVSGRGRAPGVTTLMRILGIIGFLIDLFSDSSYQERRALNSGLGGFQPADFYEVRITYTATTPSGSQISGVAKQNRPELRGSLPIEGDPLVLLYVDDGLYKLM